QGVLPTTGYPLIDILFGLKTPASGTKPVTLIQGPPGTGKTTVIVEIDEILTKGLKFRKGEKPGERIREFYNSRINEDYSQMMAVLNSVDINNDNPLFQAGAKPKISILNVSQSNGAVNNLGERLLLKENVPFVRVGNVEEKISKKLIPNWEDREKLLKQFGPSGSYVINGTNNGLKNDMYLKKYPIFVTFDVVFEDESPKSSVPETLLIASMARKKLIKLGDHKQLPSHGLGDKREALVKEEIKNGLKLERAPEEIFSLENRKTYRTSLFEEIYEGDEENILDKHFLNINRRSVWLIAKFVSELFYDGKLKHRDEGKDQWETVSEETLKIMPVIFPEEEVYGDEGYKSYRNYGELDMVLRHIDEILNEPAQDEAQGYRYNPEDLFILSPYKPQVQTIEEFVTIKAILNDFEGGIVDKDALAILQAIVRNWAARKRFSDRRVEDFIGNAHSLAQDTARFQDEIHYMRHTAFKRVFGVQNIRNLGARKISFEEIKSIQFSVATVDSIQGQENKVVIISFVRSNSEKSIGFLNTYDARQRINVAVSRAQERLIIIWDPTTLLHHPLFQ
ncbi:MAG TPA: hypothetical protein DCL49_00440, partial [Candidatus Omnitrophica bacterium]|nr:hypothetical protein [Candidatus Omnitrophota bacterium]